jgi:hypothetical protein
MRAVVILPLLFVLTFGTAFWYVSTAAICPVPVAYSLGTIDSRFNFSEAEAMAVLTRAEKLWEDATGRDLFVYEETSSFAVNFIYDERQQLASTEEEWRIRLDSKQAESEALLEQVRGLAAEYETSQAAFSEKRVTYEEHLRIYNERVETANAAGGAAEEEYAALQAEQKVLSRELAALLAEEKILAKQVDEIVRLGAEGNELVESYNSEVVQYNEVFGNIELYTQGDFKRDRINIYKFSDTTELAKVIAHEFGHALGVSHVEGEESLMYYLMEEQPDTLLLSEEDLNAFTEQCGEEEDLSDKVRRTIRKALSFI